MNQNHSRPVSVLRRIVLRRRSSATSQEDSSDDEDADTGSPIHPFVTLSHVSEVCSFIKGEGGEEMNQSAKEIRFKPSDDAEKGIEAAREISDALKSAAPSLQSLQIEDSYLGREGLWLIFQALLSQSRNKLKKISFIRCKIDDRSAEVIAMFLQANESVNELDLRFNKIGDRSARLMVEALKNNSNKELQRQPPLRTIYLHGNRVTDMSIESKLKDHVQHVSPLLPRKGDPRNPEPSFSEVLRVALCDGDDVSNMNGSVRVNDGHHDFENESRSMDWRRNDPTLVHRMHEVIIRRMEDVDDMRVFYTVIREMRRSGLVDGGSQKELVVLALQKAREIAAERELKYGDKDARLVWLHILRKVLSDMDPLMCGFIDCIVDLSVRIENMEDTVDRLVPTTHQLTAEVDHVSSSLRKLKDAFRFKLRVESVLQPIACALNIASFGILGSAVNGIVSFALHTFIDTGVDDMIELIEPGFEMTEDLVESFANSRLRREVANDRRPGHAAAESMQMRHRMNHVYHSDDGYEDEGSDHPKPGDDHDSDDEGSMEFDDGSDDSNSKASKDQEKLSTGARKRAGDDVAARSATGVSTHSRKEIGRIVKEFLGRFQLRAKKNDAQQQRSHHSLRVASTSAASYSTTTCGSDSLRGLVEFMHSHFEPKPETEMEYQRSVRAGEASACSTFSPDDEEKARLMGFLHSYLGGAKQWKNNETQTSKFSPPLQEIFVGDFDSQCDKSVQTV